MPLEKRMRLDLQIDIKVASRTSHRAGLTLAAQTELHSIIDAGRNFDFQLRLLHLRAGSAAIGALLANHPTASLAGRTRGLNPEKSLRMHDAPAAAAVVARLRLGAGSCTAPLAGGARLAAGDFQIPRTAAGRFQKVDGDRTAKMIAAMSARPAASSAVAEHPETVEEIPEGVENVRHIAELRSGTVAGNTGVSETVVTGPLIGVAQNLERFGGLFEACDGRLISPIAVGMIGDRQLFIGFFNLVGTGVFLDAQYFVIVPFSSHRNHISGNLGRSRNRRWTNGPPLPVAREDCSLNCTPSAKSLA